MTRQTARKATAKSQARKGKARKEPFDVRKVAREIMERDAEALRRLAKL